MTVKRCYPVLVGASVAENQLIGLSDNTRTVNGITVVRSEGTKLAYSGTSIVDLYVDAFAYTEPDSFLNNFVAGHKYLLSAKSSDNRLFLVVNKPYTDMRTGNRREIIYTPSSTPTYMYCRILVSNGETISGNGRLQSIDLTAMLGSTIADYLYSLEQATAGSGIAWLRSYGFLSDGYVPYNAGSIESVEATAKVVRDENNENAVTYPLGSDVLRGIFKLDANNQLYADGDRKTADGTITRKYGIVDLGTLNWNMYETNHFYANLPDVKIGLYAQLSNAMCSKYAQSTMSHLFDKTFAVNNGQPRINIYDSAYSDAATFKTSMNGVMLVYELATPTTEQSTPFTSPQIVYPDGTEEYVTGNGVPVGHETKYQL